MTAKKNPSLMPKAGSRARRVLVELARLPNPVEERALMAAHGMDGVQPTHWRQGPYLSLSSCGLIERTQDGGWFLTSMGQALMKQQEVELEREQRPALPVENMATPRSVPPFRAMAAKSWRDRVVRDGAFDFINIPSLHVGGPAS